MAYTELEKLNFRACCELIAMHTKNDHIRNRARIGMHLKEDGAIIEMCQYLVAGMYERKWKESLMTPREARYTLRRMIERGKRK